MSHDPGDENDHVALCGKEVFQYYWRTCRRPEGHDDRHGCMGHMIRGVDRDCEDCGTRSGFFLERGFERCRKCGYPGQ